ncbi:MAG: PEP/pyruvate-binding domain-containing protein, partial [Prochlorococcaceae cyanobacterium]
MPAVTAAEALVLPFAAVGMADQALVGGKSASLGELIRALGPRGVAVPDGFAITAAAYRHLLACAGLEGPLRRLLTDLDVEDLGALQRAGAAARQLVAAAPLPPDLERAILTAALGLGAGSLAVRSSATAEDLPEASFAGQ